MYGYELSASSCWKRYDDRDVTDWYERKRKESLDGQQMRRLTRELKKFARSRGSWSTRVLSGFGITKLVAYHAYIYSNREDKRSEERRVGKECDRTCRSRWSPDH